MPFGAKRLCDQELIGERSIMREHLFRGKLKNKEKWMDKGEWMEGSLLCNDVDGMIECRIIESLLTGGEEARAIAYEVDPESVCQYTGLTDKNGRKIFEGDIFIDHFDDSIMGIVRYGEYRRMFSDDELTGHVGFYIEWQKRKAIIRKDLGYWARNSEIIGNIFDNPELTEQGGDFTYEHDRK